MMRWDCGNCNSDSFLGIYEQCCKTCNDLPGWNEKESAKFLLCESCTESPYSTMDDITHVVRSYVEQAIDNMGADIVPETSVSIPSVKFVGSWKTQVVFGKQALEANDTCTADLQDYMGEPYAKEVHWTSCSGCKDDLLEECCSECNKKAKDLNGGVFVCVGCPEELLDGGVGCKEIVVDQILQEFNANTRKRSGSPSMLQSTILSLILLYHFL